MKEQNSFIQFNPLLCGSTPLELPDLISPMEEENMSVTAIKNVPNVKYKPMWSKHARNLAN